MKFLITIFLLFFSFSCQKRSVQETHTLLVSVIFDITDQHSVQPDAEQIINTFELKDDKNKEVFFRIQPLTDKTLNPTLTLHLPDGQTTEKENKSDRPLYRERVILQFYSDIRRTVNQFNASRTKDSSLGHSECFAIIATELRYLKAQRADKIYMRLYSDLQENSQIFSCYNRRDRDLLDKNPAAVIKRFNDAGLLPDDLSGFEIVGIFNPRTRTEDLQYQKMAALYKRLFESRKATFSVQANN